MNPSDPPSLFETIRVEDGAAPRLQRHLDRLEASAAAFCYPFDRGAAVHALADVASEGLWRVRLSLNASGKTQVESAPLAGEPFRTAWICPDPMSEAGGPLCRNKTTHREHYETRWREALQRGADEAIVLNGKGEVVEGSRTNVWAEIDGHLWTPPLRAGGLPGVERAHLLATRSATGVRALTPDDLRAADGLFLSNALRGLMHVELVEG